MTAIDEILAGYEGLQAAQEAFYKDLHRAPRAVPPGAPHRPARRRAAAAATASRSRPASAAPAWWASWPTAAGPPSCSGRAGRAAARGGHRRGLREHRHRHGRRRPARCRSPTPAATTCTWPACSAMAKLMADHRGQWNGTLIPLFQPAEETGDGAQDMVDDGLFKRIPVPDVALAQHLLPGIAGTVAHPLRAVHVGRRQHQGHRVRAGRPRLHCRRTPSTRSCSPP